ncbi:TonB-dependent receptor [Larkinella insperata]|uniref:TonB-dependent receptor n=1 Tax=Larkinella insperata TaxID=332158 RepID=UPI002248EE6D|nr:TonB-dependent receptor [Larkinella insperata]
MLVSIAARAQTSVLFSGLVKETTTNEPLQGVHVYVPDHHLGTVTNETGSYTLSLPTRDSLTITFSFVGYQPLTRTIFPAHCQTLDIFLTPGQQLAEVAVKAHAAPKASDQAQMSRIDVPLEQLNKIPALMGEKDVLKLLQLMPGVQKGSEGNAGVYVRGGGPDQNLITLDEAVVYNPSHLLGFFSVFNGDALQGAELTKGGFPARYGGRLSSVIEMGLKAGDRQALHGTGSIGVIASRLTLEGPLQQGKSSFVVSARQCYLGALTGLVAKGRESGVPSRLGFGDYNAKLSFELGARDQLYVSGYTSADQFKSQQMYDKQVLDAGLNWGNTTGTLRWSHRFSNRASAHAALIFSQYRMQVVSEETVKAEGQNPSGVVLRLEYLSNIRDFTFKQDWDLQAGLNHQFRLGVQATSHQFTPSAVVTAEAKTATLARTSGQQIRVVESGVYAEDYWQPTDRWRINAGLRLSYFFHPKAQYLRPEPRLSVGYKLPGHWTIKGAYAQMNQYVHMLSSTGVGLPTDLWVPTTDRVKPQQSEQVALGLVKDFDSDLALTVEGYHKTMKNNISYREGATFLVTDMTATGQKARWEDNVTAGRGWSYGGEVMLQKKTGRLSGWIGYTLSWTQWQFADLNGGRRFFPRYDRRHDLSVVGVYELSKRISLSGTWVYGTGQALTVPLSRYYASANNPDHTTPNTNPFIDTHNVKDYGAKNSFRAEPYHRMDLSLQFHTRKKAWESSWELSVYNAYNRRNPFYYSLEGKGGSEGIASKTVLYRYSLFPVVPTVSYSFRF